MNLEKNKYMVNNYLHQLFKNNVLKIVVTDGTTEIARSFLYRILTDDVFGKNQCIFVSLYELSTKTMFLESLAIELNSFSPKLLSGKCMCIFLFLNNKYDINTLKRSI